MTMKEVAGLALVMSLAGHPMANIEKPDEAEHRPGNRVTRCRKGHVANRREVCQQSAAENREDQTDDKLAHDTYLLPEICSVRSVIDGTVDYLPLQR
jgi:hypothetical protein